MVNLFYTVCYADSSTNPLPKELGIWVWNGLEFDMIARMHSYNVSRPS